MGAPATAAGMPPGWDVGNPAGAMTPKLPGSGGMAVLATGWLGWAIGSGGGVGGKLSGGGATTGFGAAAAA